MSLRTAVSRPLGHMVKGCLRRSSAVCKNVLPPNATATTTSQPSVCVFAVRYISEASTTTKQKQASGHPDFSEFYTLSHPWLRRKRVTQPKSQMKMSFGNDINRQLALDPEGKILTVTWKDGSQSRFDSSWLRHNCQCSACQQEHSGQHLFDPAALPHNICMDHVSTKGDMLEIEWLGEQQHTGVVSLSYLRDNSYEADALHAKREQVKMKTAEHTLPEMHYGHLITSSDGVYSWLKQINEAGMSLLKDVPTNDRTVCSGKHDCKDGCKHDSMVAKVAEHIGPVMNSIYGETFDVISTPKPINVAYSNVALDFHMDLVYYESPPGLQFLHCLRFDPCVTGGESRFVDVFHVAEVFRQQHPDMFHTLTRVPATFQKIHYQRDFPVEMRYQRPHIVLNHHQEIVAVNWAPAFEGPLAVEQKDVQLYYEAYEAFAKAIKFSPNILEYRLQPGDLITINNRRILHARNSFELNGGVRHLKGCYVNIDHFKSQVQVFSRLRGTGEPAKRVGNQDWL